MTIHRALFIIPALVLLFAPLTFTHAQYWYGSSYGYGGYPYNSYPYTYQNYSPYSYSYSNYYAYQQPSCSISITSPSYGYGGYYGYGYQQPVTLSWSSSYATAAVITPNVGSVATQGSTTVYPSSENRTYTLTVSGPGGTYSCTTPYYQQSSYYMGGNYYSGYNAYPYSYQSYPYYNYQYPYYQQYNYGYPYYQYGY